MEAFFTQLKALFPALPGNQVLTSIWAEAMMRAEALQIGLVVLTFLLSMKMRKPLTELKFHHWKFGGEVSRALAWPLLWLLGIVVSRAVLSSSDLPVTYLDIAALMVAAWLIYRAMSLTRIKPGTRRAITLALLVIPALMITDRMGDVIAFLEAARFSAGDVNISLWSICKAIAVFVFLFWIFKGLSGLLEEYLARSSNITPSARTLITKLVNITGLVLVFLIALNAVGVDLTALTFFGGALGIGIGFGLKTITSNFISGIILLMDKSVKPGDVVSIGDAYGTIEELNSRYAVLRRRDGTEMLIPNENLITTEVINWSFSNRKIRAAIKVGVAYNSDLKEVQKILLNIAREHPRVLESPEPKAFITEFGDSSINFELRFWIIDPEAGMGSIRSDLFMEIWETFREKGIEIPFPQRVLHMTA